MRKLTHYVAPPLPIQAAAAGLGWGPQIYPITLRLGLQCPLSPDPFTGGLEMLLRLLTKISELIGWFLP